MPLSGAIMRETAREIDAAAALWAVRADAGPLSAAEEAAFEAWLAGDARRVGAYARARAIAVHTERAAALKGFDPAHFVPQPRILNPRVLIAGGGAAGLAASIAAGVWLARERDYEHFATRLGQVRVVSLADGSIVTLNTASKIAVRYSEVMREVTLIAGEALFDVAHETARPFVVEAGAMLVRAIGTSFSVRRLPRAPAEVLVREGVVEVSQRGQARAPLRLEAHLRAVADADAPLVATPVADADLGRALAWRDGRIAFEGETLAVAAAEFARYSETRIVFTEAEIAEEPITGLFVSTDPVGFARAVALAFDLDAETREGEVRLSRRSKPGARRGG